MALIDCDMVRPHQTLARVPQLPPCPKGAYSSTINMANAKTTLNDIDLA